MLLCFILLFFIDQLQLSCIDNLTFSEFNDVYLIAKLEMSKKIWMKICLIIIDRHISIKIREDLIK